MGVSASFTYGNPHLVYLTCDTSGYTCNAANQPGKIYKELYQGYSWGPREYHRLLQEIEY